MRKMLTGLLAAAAMAAAMAQPLPEVAVGRIERLPPIASTFVDARPVDVWLPADYSPAKRYDVLYMHDGQMLFDASKSWNHQAWDVHLAVDRLVKAGRIPDTIVVGIWNNDKLRHSEYFPEKFLPFLPEPLRQAFIDKALQGRPRAARLRKSSRRSPRKMPRPGARLNITRRRSAGSTTRSPSWD